MPYEEFLESARKYAEAELAENNRNPNAYIFLADLSEDITEKYMLTGYALFLDRSNKEVNTKFNEAKGKFGDALYASIDKNNLDFVKDAMNRNLLNGFEHNKTTPFNYAVSKDNAEAMDLLMPAGTDKFALLYYVIENGGQKIAGKLLKSIDVNQAPRANGHDLLTASVFFDKKEIAFELLRNNFQYKNSIQIAKYTSPELYKKTTAFLSMYAITKDDAKMFEDLIRMNPSVLKPNSDGKGNVVDDIVKANKTALFPVLLKYGLNVKDPNYTYLLELAINSSAEDIGIELVKQGIDLNYQPNGGGSYINQLATKTGMNQLFSTLIQNGVSISALNDRNELPLVTSMRNKQINKTTMLLKNGSPMNFNSKLSGNQIHWIVENNIETSFIPILMDYKVDINGKNSQGDSPLFYALKEKKPVYIRALLENGSDVNSINNTGISPLQYAVYSKSGYLFSMVQNCSNPNVQGINGWTALLFAVREGNMDAVNILLNANANPMVADKWGRTPYRLSREYGQLEIQKVLRQKMGLGNIIKTSYAFNKKKPVS